MMSIFEPLKLPPLGDYMKYIFKEKNSPTTSNGKSSSKKNDETLGGYIYKELFQPTQEENIATSEYIKSIEAGVAICRLVEMRSLYKLTLEHLSSEGGHLSWLNATTTEHEASKGKETNNENTESFFGRLTVQLWVYSTIAINHAATLALAWFNKDFYCGKVELAKRQKRKVGKYFPISR